MTTSAKPIRDTLPAATSRGNRCSRPSGVCPAAGLRTPSASHGSPGSGDMTVPMRVKRYGMSPSSVTRQPLTPEPMSLDVKWRWKTTNSAITGAASTHAPARMDPNGLAARDARLEM